MTCDRPALQLSSVIYHFQTRVDQHVNRVDDCRFPIGMVRADIRIGPGIGYRYRDELSPESFGNG